MNKPFTCPQCGTTFDLLPGQDNAHLAKARAVRVKCPGCYTAGYQSVPGVVNPEGSKGNMVYTVDLKTLTIIS